MFRAPSTLNVQAYIHGAELGVITGGLIFIVEPTKVNVTSFSYPRRRTFLTLPVRLSRRISLPGYSVQITNKSPLVFLV